MLTRHLTCFSYTPSGSMCLTCLTWKQGPFLSSVLCFESGIKFHGNLCLVVNLPRPNQQKVTNANICGCRWGLLLGFKESSACKIINLPVKLHTFLRLSVCLLTHAWIRLQTSPSRPSVHHCDKPHTRFPSFSFISYLLREHVCTSETKSFVSVCSWVSFPNRASSNILFMDYTKAVIKG